MLLYFAAAKSYTGKQLDFLKAPFVVNQLYDHLEKLYPGIRKQVLDSCALTINEEYVDNDNENSGLRMIYQGDEAAIIPPVSSG